MATNLELITDALREINVINEVQTPTAEQGTQALRKLNQMLEEWKEDSLDLKWYKQSSTAATAPIPDFAETAVIMGLAIYCAPQYGASISVETAAKADNSITILRRKLITEKLDNADMTHLPIGSGHVVGTYDITTDS